MRPWHAHRLLSRSWAAPAGGNPGNFPLAERDFFYQSAHAREGNVSNRGFGSPPIRTLD